MTNDDRTRFERLDQHAQEFLGKRIEDCDQDDIDTIAGHLRLRAAAGHAAVDQAEAVQAEAERCGCPIVGPALADGSPDIARARVMHSCPAVPFNPPRMVAESIGLDLDEFRTWEVADWHRMVGAFRRMADAAPDEALRDFLWKGSNAVRSIYADVYGADLPALVEQ